MKHWQYQNPVAIHFGAGVLDTLPKVLAGRTATLVTFPEAESFGHSQRCKWPSSVATSQRFPSMAQWIQRGGRPTANCP